MFGATEFLWVVETEDDQFLGTVEVVDQTVVIRNGFRGHPVTVDISDITSMEPAAPPRVEEVEA